MTEQRHLDLVDRLRGQYHLPVDDGGGPLNGSMTFSRQFPTSPIKKEAAAEIERLRSLNADMLEALNKAEEWLSGWASAEPYIDIIRAVIAKANGKQP